MSTATTVADDKPFVVRCIRIDGGRSDFNCYASRQAAEDIARHLVRVGCPAEVVELPSAENHAPGP